MITKDNIKTLFNYCADGVLTWKIEPNYVTKIDDVAGSLRKGHKYHEIRYKTKYYPTHRLIYLWHTGELPEYVDHVNRNKLDNRIENLRAISKSDNAINSDKVVGKVGYRGVSTTAEGRFKARIKKNYCEIALGVYDTAEEAAQAYQNARKGLFPQVYR